MAGGYTTPDGSGWSFLSDQIRGIWKRLGELETPSGTQVANLVAQVQAALANITTTVTLAIQSLSYTKSEIDTKIASPGAIAPSTVTASGAVSAAGDLSTAGALIAPSVYSTTLSTDYRAVWVSNPTGQLGYVPSSLKFKQDVETAILDDRLMTNLRLVTFRYIAAVAELGDDAERVVGMIAEEVHGLGATWLVDYQDGEPFGLKYDRVLFVVMAWAQRADQRLSAIEAHLGIGEPGA